MALDLNQLRVFTESVRTRNYTLAAKRLHVCQSAVSHAIRRLEASAGRRLVEWRGRQFSLTEDGKVLYEACERIFTDLEGVNRRFSTDAARTTHRAVLGATVEFGSTVLIRKMAPFIQEHPELHVDFHFAHDLLGALVRDEVDLSVDCRLHRHPALQHTDLFRERYAVVAAPRFVRRHGVRSPRDLGELPVLSMDADGAWWDNLLRALPAGERPLLRRVVTVDHVRAIVNAAIEGLGVGFVPKYAVLRELESQALVELFAELPILEDTFRVYQKKSRAGSEVNRLLTAHLLSLDPAEFGDAISAVA